MQRWFVSYRFIQPTWQLRDVTHTATDVKDWFCWKRMISWVRSMLCIFETMSLLVVTAHQQWHSKDDEHFNLDNFGSRVSER